MREREHLWCRSASVCVGSLLVLVRALLTFMGASLIFASAHSDLGVHFCAQSRLVDPFCFRGRCAVSALTCCVAQTSPSTARSLSLSPGSDSRLLVGSKQITGDDIAHRATRLVQIGFITFLSGVASLYRPTPAMQCLVLTQATQAYLDSPRLSSDSLRDTDPLPQVWLRGVWY